MADLSKVLMVTILAASACASCTAEPTEAINDNRPTPVSDAADKEVATQSVENTQTVEKESGSDEIVTCSPGCALKNDKAGLPIVPEWCLAWSPIAPVCVRNGENVYCIGRWAGAGRIINTPSAPRTDFQLQSAEEIARSPYKPFTEINFMCTRIDAAALARAIPTSPTAEGLLGEERAESCVPGCLVGRGLVRETPSSEKPEWCYRLASEYVYGRKDPDEPELALCSRLKPRSN